MVELIFNHRYHKEHTPKHTHPSTHTHTPTHPPTHPHAMDVIVHVSGYVPYATSLQKSWFTSQKMFPRGYYRWGVYEKQDYHTRSRGTKLIIIQAFFPVTIVAKKLLSLCSFATEILVT